MSNEAEAIFLGSLSPKLAPLTMLIILQLVMAAQTNSRINDITNILILLIMVSGVGFGSYDGWQDGKHNGIGLA